MEKEYPNIVSKNPIITIDDQDTCPMCNSTLVEQLGYQATMVGSNAEKFSHGDPNHYWFSMICENCSYKYVKQQKKGKLWYTSHDNETLLKGMPNCFESVIFKCSYCKGYVIENREMDSTTYKCTECKREETINRGIK